MGAHVVFLGPSGSGKTSLMLGLSREEGEYLFTLDKPRTTRAQRPGESNDEYEFLTQAEFDQQRSNFLFTMTTYGKYEFGLVKQAPLAENEFRMRILLPVNALKFRELVKEPTIMCLVKPIDGVDLGEVIKQRDPNISPEDLTKRIASIQQDINESEELADIIFVNHQGVESATKDLVNQIIEYSGKVD